MAFVFYSDGIGGSTGDSLVSASPLLATGVLYVDSVTGSDSYDGVQRSRPKATLAGAYAAAANGYVIVLLSTHSEQIASVVTVSLKNITIVGEGSSGGYPTAVLGGGNNVRITFSGDDCQLRNVKFTTSTATNSSSNVVVTGKRFSSAGNRFELTATDGCGLEIGVGSSYSRTGNDTFISTSTTIAAVPTYGMIVANGADGLELDGTVFSDGQYGFASYAFSYVSSTFPNIRAENLSLLLGAEFNCGTPYGYVHVGTSTGGGRVI